MRSWFVGGFWLDGFEMKNSLTLIATSLILCGCQASRHSLETEGLSQRLAVVERARLTSAEEASFPGVSIGRSSSGSYGRGTDFPPGSTTTPTNRSDALAWKATTPQNDDFPWTLTAIDESALLEQPDAQDQSDAAFWAEKEDKYLRRRPLPSFWDTLQRDLKHMPADLWRDTKRVYTKPLNLVILGTAYGGSLALQEAGPDDTVEHHFRRDRPFGRHEIHRHFSSGWRDAFGAAGNPATHFALAGLWYLAGQQTMDDKTYEVGKTLFSALAINGATVLLGQAATADKSPNGERGTFPSGHTSSTFVLASVLDEAYGPAVGIPLYLLGGLVAHERLEDGEHNLSDVLMGAVLGTVIGHSVASGRDPEFFGWKVLPYASPEGGTGIAFMKTLP